MSSTITNTGRSASFPYGKGMCCWDQAAVILNHSGVPLHNFIAGGAATEGALPTRPSIDTWSSCVCLPYLARWLFTRRKAFFQQQGARTCLWQAWAAQNSQRRKPCAGRWPGTETVQMSLPTWYFQTNSACSSQYKFVLHQEEVCTNLTKPLKLFHILTYEGIFSHNFLQWNCKWLVTRILAITTTRSWTPSSTLATFFLHDHFFSEQPPPQVL